MHPTAPHYQNRQWAGLVTSQSEAVQWPKPTTWTHIDKQLQAWLGACAPTTIPSQSTKLVKPSTYQQHTLNDNKLYHSFNNEISSTMINCWNIKKTKHCILPQAHWCHRLIIIIATVWFGGLCYAGSCEGKPSLQKPDSSTW